MKILIIMMLLSGCAHQAQKVDISDFEALSHEEKMQQLDNYNRTGYFTEDERIKAEMDLQRREVDEMKAINKQLLNMQIYGIRRR